MSEQTYWNGLPAPARKVRGVVAQWREGDPPLAWWRSLVGQQVDAVEVDLDGVNFGGGTLCLWDGDGSGWAKITAGRGGPDYGHREIRLVPSTITERDADR